MEELLTASGLVSFLSLTLMEVVLGIDNIVFISILVARLPEEQQGKGRMIGIGLALLIRVALLFAIAWLIGASEPLFEVLGMAFSIRDLILIAGGLFLLYKSTSEIHHKLEGEEESNKEVKVVSFSGVITQIVLLDIVFSFDSILTAIGLVDDIMVMVIAVIIAMGVMLLAAKSISSFIEKHPTVKMLALSFLLLIGVMLVLEGFEVHIPKFAIYFAIFFSLFVEFLNIRTKKKKDAKPVHLHQQYKE
ncbi:TerC family protein [Nafulsella turpanensis]|uniref:TerC family protein n=1 Tax=Nafulsella turpanensis TaxID=1265690 RepID=UPI000347ACFD|nr:TerC family protein [Nafulsella turpanensis]